MNARLTRRTARVASDARLAAGWTARRSSSAAEGGERAAKAAKRAKAAGKALDVEMPKRKRTGSATASGPKAGANATKTPTPKAVAATQVSRVGLDGKSRCFWCTDEPLYTVYHDEEWGRPVREDNKLFEMICLEGAQAGLSWLTVLKKRENYRAAFKNFDIAAVAAMTDEELAEIVAEQDATKAVVRHKGKVLSVRGNAVAALAAKAEFGSFSAFLWSYAPAQAHSLERKRSNPTSTAEAEVLSKELKRRGFKFVGPTIVYAFMQAVGMVNDHLEGCFLERNLEAEKP